MTDSDHARGLIALGFNDYVAARFLINHDYVWQGTVLASSAVEKYLKGVLAIRGIRCKFHLDSIGQIKKLFKKTEYDVIFDKLDPVFLEILGKAYRYRYYDVNTLTKPDTVGFIINQFLGELDYTICLIDKIFNITDETGKRLDTQLIKAVKKKNNDLVENNYLIEGVTKKDFMNRKSDAFGLHISPKFFGTEIEIKGSGVIGPYDGTIWRINVTNT